MNFSRFLDIQSWWEVPSIAYFCSLFRTAFNLLDFDIEELEEALLTDGTEDSASSLLTELIVRLLNGCLGNNDISAFNYQMYLRRLFRRKCQETGRYNPFDSDIDFQFLPLRTKVEILYALCDFRLDADDVFDLFKNLEAESLRVEPLGWDDNDSAYWYFYGTRLYREDIIRKSKNKGKRKKNKETKRRGWGYGDDWLDDEDTERVWQVICFTEEDWTHLTEKFSKATSKVEKELYRSLSQNFLPEIPRLFQEKERLQRKRLLESAPRRTSSRVLQKIKQKEEESKQSSSSKEYDDVKDPPELARKIRAKRRNLVRSQSMSSEQTTLSSEQDEMPQKLSKRSKSQDRKSKHSKHQNEPPPEPVLKRGRKTNNSLSAATGQIVIPDNDEPPSSTRKKLKTSQIFSQTEEDVQTDMYKVLEQLLLHDDAWPFLDPVEEEFAPNYYAVIRRPMDLRKMEERLDHGYYTDFSMFKADFKLIVNNCRLYNGHDNEYSVMVDNLQAAFDRLTQKYIHRLSSSDEEIAVEYQLPTPSRKHKLKSRDSPSKHKRKKRKTHSEIELTESDQWKDDKEHQDAEIKQSKESQRMKGKKKRKGHHRHGKHSKSHKKRSSHSGTRSSKHKRQKHMRDKEGKKSKQRKKKSKHSHQPEPEEIIQRSPSQESIESSHRSRSASPLPSIHTLTPSPTDNLEQIDDHQHNQLIDPDFYKDKYDKIKERRRNATKDSWDSLFTHKQKGVDRKKQNLNIPQKDKNQKLQETIEKLRAKNEKYKDTSLFNTLFNPRQNDDKKFEPYDGNDIPEPNSETTRDETYDDTKEKQTKKGGKKVTAKNESASEALEQAVKDISKWLDDAPKTAVGNQVCDSPSRDFVDDLDIIRGDDELSQSERTLLSRRDVSRKRLSSREPKLLKRREIQRTIDRLQPGKSKGNLLTNINVNKTVDKIEEIAAPGTNNKVRDTNKADEPSPKLSLGSVLPTVEFVFGPDHSFDNSDKCVDSKEKSSISETQNNHKQETTSIDTSSDPPSDPPVKKKDAEVETELTLTTKPNQEKATPNLSAWFKAFGTPKSNSSTTIKKKSEDTEIEDKVNDNPTVEKLSSPKNTSKSDSPNDPDNNEGGDSPIPSTIATPRQRRTSTGSSVSERSSFSQDLDSPRHQMSHTSPLLRSPASPRTDDFQKITYPIMNGTVRAGFYQDTTSVKSSPDKSCSPREAPQSPYSPYTQHVYASNSVMGSTTPNYFIDQNKSPISSYISSAQCEILKVASKHQQQKSAPFSEDYTSLPEPHNHGNFSPKSSSYQQTQSTNYSHVDISSQSTDTELISPINITHSQADPKGLFFPVKKRTYNEQDGNCASMKRLSEAKQSIIMTPSKNEYQKTQSNKIIRDMSAPLIDNIALALCEKSENKMQGICQKSTADITNKKCEESRVFSFDNGLNNNVKINSNEGNKSLNALNNDDIDMVNMGYMNPENDRRLTSDSHDNDFSSVRESQRQNITHQKSYDAALNLGVQTMQKIAQKHPLPESHQSDSVNKNVAHMHHTQYEPLSMHQSVGKFSLNDIELANKKLYTCNAAPSSAALDYGNWKVSNQMRKDVPSDYSNPYHVSNNEKLISNIGSNSPVNYNKNSQNTYSNDYNMLRSMQRTPDMQQNLSSELRIPNPRNILRNDHGNAPSSVTNPDLITRNNDGHTKSQKPENSVGTHSLVGSIPYKSQFSSHSTIPLESLRNLPNIPQIMERFSSDERFLSGFAGNTSSIFHDKSFQMAQMFNKSLSSDVLSDSPSVSIYHQTSASTSKDKCSITTTSDSKSRSKKKKTPESKPGIQSYHTTTSGSDVLSSVKTSMIPGSPFNFGSSTNMTLASGLYGDSGGFTIEDFRNSNQIMAANYMAAAVAHQQIRTTEANAEKLAKPAHQSSNHSSSFPFIGHSQVRASYPFVGPDPSSPLYQQYLQRHQAEELLRQTGAQIMGLYSPGYPASLGVRQPYDSLNRPSWL